MIRSTGPSPLAVYQNWIKHPSYEQRLQEWQNLSDKDRSAIWLYCEQNDANYLKELWKIEWQLAEQYFATDDHKNDLKMSHKNGTTRHSFIKVKNDIFMLARKEKVLGEGAFGKVKPTYLKGDEGDVLNKNGDQCIVKVIKTKKIDDENAVAKEAGALEAVGELYAKEERVIKENEKKIYLVAKRHAGKELMSVLNENELSYAQLLIVAYQCCELVENAHKRGYLHLDLKSENFMIDITNGEIKVALIDWGLSQKLPDGQNEIAVGTIGTPGFIPPEMLVKDGKASKASDIFSLGVMFKTDLRLIESDYGSILNYDADKRASLAEQKQKLLKSLHMIDNNDIDNDQYIKEFISQHPINNEPDDNQQAANDAPGSHTWQSDTIDILIQNMKQNFLEDLGEGYLWLFTAAQIREIIEELKQLRARPDLTDPEKLELVADVLHKAEEKFFGKTKSIFTTQCDFLEWNRDVNRVFDVFENHYAVMNESQKAFFDENIQIIANQKVEIEDDLSFSYKEKSIQFKAAIQKYIDTCIFNALLDPRYNDIIPILEKAVMEIKGSVEETMLPIDDTVDMDRFLDQFEEENYKPEADLLDEMDLVDDSKKLVEDLLDEMDLLVDDSKKPVADLLAEMGFIADDNTKPVEDLLNELDELVETNSVSEINDLEATIDVMQIEAVNEVKNTLQMPQFNQLIENLIEFNRYHVDEKLSRIIDLLQEKIQRPYYQKHPKQCIEGVMAENNEFMSTIEVAEFLVKQLEPWEVATPKIHEQIAAHQNEVAEFAKNQELEAKKMAALKENIFDYAIYLFNQIPSLTEEALTQHSLIIKHIKNRKLIDYDNEGFLNNLMSLQKNNYDLRQFSDIQDDIKEVCEQLQQEYGIDLNQSSDRNVVKKVVLAAAIDPGTVVRRPLPQIPTEARATDFNKFLKTEEAFLKKHAVVKELLNGLRNDLSTKRGPVESAYVLEMNRLVQKIESLPDDMPEKIKMGVIKSYLLSKEQELKNAKLSALYKQLDSSVANAIDQVYRVIAEEEWPEPDTQVEAAVRNLSIEETANVELFQRAIHLITVNFKIINEDDSVLWSDKPTNDDLVAISKQLQQKLDLINEGIIKIDPQKELQFILKNATANHRLTKLADTVARELNIELGSEPVHRIVPNKENMQQQKLDNATRAKLIEEMKINWQKLTELLIKKEKPDQNDHLIFSQERLEAAITQLKRVYENANSAKKHNLTTYVIPQLEKQFYDAKKRVIKHYIAYQKQNIALIKEEHEKIRDLEKDALKYKEQVLAKVNLQVTPEIKMKNPADKENVAPAAISESQLKNAAAGLKKVIQAPKVVAENPLLAEIRGKEKRPLPELPKASASVDKILEQMQQIDEEVQKEQQALKAAYNTIIAYDPKAPKGSITAIVEQLLAKQRVVNAKENEQKQRQKIAEDLPKIFDEATRKAQAKEALMQQQLAQVVATSDKLKDIMLKNIERALAPIALDDLNSVRPLPVFPIEPTVAFTAEKLVREPPEVKKALLLERPLPPAPVNIDRILKDNIDSIQLAELNKGAQRLVEQHHDSFTLNSSDKEVVENLKKLNEKLNERQRLAEQVDPKLDELSKSLQAVEEKHASAVNDMNRRITEAQVAHKKDMDLLAKALNANLAKRKNDEAKIKQISSQLDTALKDPVSAYHAKVKHQENLFARKWLKHQAKSFGRRVYGKERSRTKQTRFIQDVFLGIAQDIPSNDIQSMKDKILVAYQCLAQVQKEILNEKNTFESDLFLLCDEKMKVLEGILNDLSAVSPKVIEKPNLTEEAFLKMVFYKPRNPSDLELPLELQMVYNCKKYNSIPQDFTQFGNGGTLTMLEGTIKRQMDQIEYFAQHGQGPAKLEAIKLHTKLIENKEWQRFQEKSAERAKKMITEKPKQLAPETLTGSKLQEQRKKLIDQKVAKLKADHFNETPSHPKKTNK